MKIAATSKLDSDYGLHMVENALDQLRGACGSLHVATQHLPMNLGLVASELNTKLNHAELALEDLERAVRHQLPRR